MVPPATARRGTFARRELIKTATIRIHNRARGRVRARIERVWNSIEILIGRADLNVLVNSRTGVGGTRWGIYDLEIPAKCAAIDDTLFEIREWKHRALQAIG